MNWKFCSKKNTVKSQIKVYQSFAQTAVSLTKSFLFPSRRVLKLGVGRRVASFISTPAEDGRPILTQHRPDEHRIKVRFGKFKQGTLI